MATPPSSCTLGQLARLCGAVCPDQLAAAVIRGAGTLQDAREDQVSWISEPRHRAALQTTRAAGIIGTAELLGGHARGLVVTDPEFAMAQVLDRFYVPHEKPELGVHPTAVIHPSAKLGTDVRVGAHCVLKSCAQVGDRSILHPGVHLGSGVRVGRDCVLHDRCVVYDGCEIGNNVILHAGAVIGLDGFGFIFREGEHRRLAHVGGVVIEDQVEIGANSCVARAKLGVTRIGRGSKIDSLVIIAHNVQIGPLCILAGQCGLSGSVELGTGVVLGGQVGVSHGLRLGDGARVAAQSGVTKSFGPGEVIYGFPARPHMIAKRSEASLHRLPELVREVAELSRRVAELEASADHPKHR
jgi:UDP-3-O-[3-hydroxymyristoyl] glucosamine N-acyltransferase